MDEERCADLLRDMDQVIAKDTVAGETTCALAVLTPEEIFGASVGDSGIWLIPTNGIHTDLTSRQQRKPLLGSGCAYPVSFRHRTQSGFLLLASDGLLKYTSAENIIETCRQPASDIAAQQLIELVRYSSGALPDDVTLILTKL
jgi:serine/threonine protein phosphatase PrpC